MIPLLFRRWSLPSRPHALRPQCAVNWDRNLKPKLAIMRQCTSVTERQTDGQTDRHWHRSISARCIYYISHSKSESITKDHLWSLYASHSRSLSWYWHLTIVTETKQQLAATLLHCNRNWWSHNWLWDSARNTTNFALLWKLLASCNGVESR